MFRNIIESILSKGFTSISNFISVILTAQFLGAEGRGEVTLIILAISIVGIFQNLIGGSAITFYTNQYASKSLLLISFLWLFLVSITIPFLLIYFSLCPKIYLLDVIFISFLIGGISIFQSILLGMEKIRLLNIIEFLKAFLLLLFLIIHFYFIQNISIFSVIHYYFISAIISFSIVILMSYKNLKGGKILDLKTITNKVFKMGFEMQINNILQLINYRFCFYLIEKLISIEALGIVSVAVSLAETIWIICKSVSTVLFSKLINEKDQSKKIQLTVSFSKLSYILTFLATIFLILIPNIIYTTIFGNDFHQINIILISYSPSILFLAFFTILIHYFSASNQNKINILATFIGNVFVVILGFILIPIYGIIGSGIAISFAYFMMFCFLIYQFKIQTKSKLKEFFSNFSTLKTLRKNA